MSNITQEIFQLLGPDSYVCDRTACIWKFKQENTDWGYYSKTNGDCVTCKRTCDNDTMCGGVECGQGYCSWWKIDACLPHELTTGGFTCLKPTEG